MKTLRKNESAIWTGTRYLMMFVIIITPLSLSCDTFDLGPLNEVRGYAEEIGVLSKQVEPSETIQIVCDASLGSTCTNQSLSDIIGVVLNYLQSRPDSIIEVWNLGASVETTTIVVKATVPVISETEDSDSDTRSWPAETKKAVLKAMRPVWDQPPTRRTPLAESLTVVARTDGVGKRTIVVLTDAREYRIGDFECHPPKPERWRRMLERKGALPVGSLRDYTIIFIYTNASPERCAANLRREARVHELWRDAMTRAGAEFRIKPGPLRQEDLSGEAKR